MLQDDNSHAKFMHANRFFFDKLVKSFWVKLERMEEWGEGKDGERGRMGR